MRRPRHSWPTRLAGFSYRVFFTFLLRYRRTALGPLWTLVSPALFVVTLGFLYGHIGNHAANEFLPHIAVGLITWNLLQNLITDAAGVYHRGRANILQGQLGLDDLVMIEVMTSVLIFVHQCLVIAAVFIACKTPISFYWLVSFVGIALIILNGVWMMRLFGLLGARYRDLGEVLPAIMRIGFLATPILWMTDRSEGRGGFLGAFQAFNPFYHFIELVRAPLLGHAIDPLSWIVVLAITAVGFVAAHFVARRFAHLVALWV